MRITAKNLWFCILISYQTLLITSIDLDNDEAVSLKIKIGSFLKIEI